MVELHINSSVYKLSRERERYKLRIKTILTGNYYVTSGKGSVLPVSIFGQGRFGVILKALGMTECFIEVLFSIV